MITHTGDVPLLSFNALFALLMGVGVGLVLAIPVGPTAVLCMRRTLERGPLYGFATGLGASLADAVYGAVAAFGIAAVSIFLHDHFVTVRLAGGIFMLVLAIRLIRAHGLPKQAMEKSVTGHAVGAAISGFFLTVTNPMTMVGFAAVFASLHIHQVVDNFDLAVLLVLGVALGSALWWMMLTLGTMRLRNVLSERTLHRINLFAGCLLALFAGYALFTVFQKILSG